jgi:hypothetical protein
MVNEKDETKKASEAGAGNDVSQLQREPEGTTETGTTSEQELEEEELAEEGA